VRTTTARRKRFGWQKYNDTNNAFILQTNHISKRKKKPPSKPFSYFPNHEVSNKQTSKQTSKQTNKQTNKQLSNSNSIHLDSRNYHDAPKHPTNHHPFVPSSDDRIGLFVTKGLRACSIILVLFLRSKCRCRVHGRQQ